MKPEKEIAEFDLVPVFHSVVARLVLDGYLRAQQVYV